MHDRAGGRELDWGAFYHHGYPIYFGWVLAVVFSGIALFLLLVPPPSLWLLVFVPLDLALAGISLRIARIGAHFKERGLVIVRVLATVIIPWDQVELFGEREREGLPYACALTKDGRVEWIPGVGPWLRFAYRPSDGLRSTIAQMNEHLSAIHARKV